MAVYSSVSKTHISYTTLTCSACGLKAMEDGKQHGLLILSQEVSAARHNMSLHICSLLIFFSRVQQVEVCYSILVHQCRVTICLNILHGLPSNAG